MKLLITCAKGVSEFLEREILALGLPVHEVLAAGVRTEGNWKDVYRLNLHLRTAMRVLMECRRFRCNGPNDLYREAKKFPWEEWIEPRGYFSVSTSVRHPTIRDIRFAGLKIKDAVVDRMRDKTGRRPNSGPETDRSVLFLHWRDEQASLYIDTSGEALSRRGYRERSGGAPMQEALAAAMIMASEWDGESHLVNPMCGTGTLAIEGLLLALNRAPALQRKNFGFMHLRNYDPMLWKQVVEEARAQEKEGLDIIVRASDKELEMVRASARNAHVAKVAEWLRMKHAPFQETKLSDGGGVVLINPPYGERLLNRDELIPLYQDMGSFIKHQCQGYKAYVISSSVKLLKQVELKPARSWTLYNGPLECRLNEYEVF